MPDQNVRPRLIGRTSAGFREYIAADRRDARALQRFDIGPAILVLDLEVVAG